VLIRGVDYNGNSLIADCCDVGVETTDHDGNEDGVIGIVNESVDS
jgi:hypothetical protein